ncbi:MAG: ABC-type dipeptide/oligopeptide/nickel transport system, permease component [halophilic archaeon J07HX5]|nr:MAG: ABC-type dipeptide/oligopeptide/nickel transport system, permease component [halophilic archaeon J07HX5]
MKWYVAKRVAWSAVASLIILTIAFVLLDAVPNQSLQTVEFQAQQQGQSGEEAVEAARERLGIDGPLHERYIDFLINFAQFDWGWSNEYQQPVTETIIESLPYSMMYGVPSIIVSTVLGMAIGLYSAINQYTKTDYAATLFAFFGVSIPNWWFGIILLVLFGVGLGWLPIEFNERLAQNANGSLTLRETVDSANHPAFIGDSDVTGEQQVGVFTVRNLKQLVLPTFVSMTAGIAAMMRYARAEALEYVDAEFVKTAKSKGVSNWRIVARHILRPAAVPLSTILVGRFLGLFLTGSYLIEVVFGIPGLGVASFTAIENTDQDLVLATVLIPTFIVLVGNLMQDIAYVVLDPRISYGDRT